MAAEIDIKKKKKILLVEDDEDIRNLIIFNLGLDNEYIVFSTDNGEEALEISEKNIPDLIILDIMLPGIDGFEVCRVLKSNLGTRHIPVLMLTARSDDQDVIKGFELGAEDYMRKPFSSMKVLMARIKNILKKYETLTGELIKFDGVTIDPLSRTVSVDGKNIELSNSEFKILQLLAENPEVAYPRDVIYNCIRAEEGGAKKNVTLRSIDVQVLSIRKKLQNYGRFIQTVRGMGYIFKKE